MICIQTTANCDLKTLNKATFDVMFRQIPVYAPLVARIAIFYAQSLTLKAPSLPTQITVL